MSRHRVLGATLAWLVVVASVSALVWVVISRAGDDLVSSEQPLLTTGDAPSGSPSSSPRRPRRSPTPSRSASPSAEPPAEPTVSPTAETSEETPSTRPPSPPVEVERRTWQGRTGSVVVECGTTGSRLVSAQPANGFRAEVKDDDGLLAVEFEGREEESGTDVTVVARCVGGIPTFSIASSDE